MAVWPPRRRSEHLLDAGSLARWYGYLGILSTAAVLGAFLLFLHTHGWTRGEAQAPARLIGAEAMTIVFLGIVLLQIGNAFACRTERTSVFTVGVFSNRFLLWGIAFEAVLAAALIYLPSLQPLFGTAGVGGRWWALFLAGAPVIFLIEEARKLMARRRGHPVAPGGM